MELPSQSTCKHLNHLRMSIRRLPFFYYTIICFISCYVLASCSKQEKVVRYYSKVFQETDKNSADFIFTSTKKGDLWYGVVTYAKTGVIQSEGNYKDDKMMKPVGTFKNNNEDGSLKNIAVYDKNSNPQTKTYYYTNGKVRSVITYKADGSSTQSAWDLNGVEIHGFTPDREVEYPEGFEAWNNYVYSHINATRLANIGVPVGTYKVSVIFAVDSTGRITDVSGTSEPACRQCVQEAENIIGTAGKWQPAIENGRPVKIYLMQPVTIQIKAE